MLIWTTIVNKLKEVMRKMTNKTTIQDALNITPSISNQMEAAIMLWSNMYRDKAPWLHEPDANNPVRVASLGLPSLIASEKARTALLEFESEITAPNKDLDKDIKYIEPDRETTDNTTPKTDNITPATNTTTKGVERAKYLNKQYAKLKRQLRKQLEYGIAKGGLVIKPYVVSSTVNENETAYEIEFDFIQADAFYPLAFDASGKITEAVFVQTQTERDIIYRRLEYHKWQDNTATIINRAFKAKVTNSNSMATTDLGKEIPLTEVSSWKDLDPEVVIENVQRPLFAYFKMPDANTIDTTSPLGVSGYSRAVNLIKDADMQYSRLLWEYEAGEMAIDIDRDALLHTDNGDGTKSTVPPILQQRLFRPVDLGTADTYQPYAPELRDNAYLRGLNAILMRIEDVVGFGRGTLSDVAQEAKTATEIKILKQRSYQTNAEIQTALEGTLKDSVYVADVYCDLYEITPEGEYEISFTWDDSIITDADTELAKRITLLQNGLTSKREVRQWYFGETERQATEALQEIEEETQNDMEKSLVMKPYEPKNVPGMPKDKEF